MIVNAQKVILKSKYKAYIFFYIFNLFVVHSFAQKQANIWHFGDGRSIDFSSGVPVMLSGSQIQGAKRGSASYSDSFGNLLFYTNGGGREPFTGQATGSIWNRNHTVMHDMAGVEGGGVTRQNSIIVEAPGQDSVYYLFTMDEVTWDQGASATTIAAQPGGRGLSYFTIDMRLNNGLGNIVVASQLVFTPSYSALTAIRHANGHDYWIINHLNSVGFGVFLLNSAGVFQIGSYVLPAPYFINNTTQLKASPDGSMIFSATGIWYAPDPLVISFDKATGQLSNPVLLPDFGAEPEFSPNSRYLYGFKEISLSATSHRYRIIRFDLQNLSNIPTPDIIDSLSFSGFTFMHPQLAPDGNIYTMTSNSSNLYHRIDRISCPNTQQATLDTGVFTYTTNAIDFLHFFPNFPPHLFENNDDAFVALGPDTARICDLGSSFVLNAQNPGASYLWSTGDTTQSITITAPGAYSVTVNGFCGSGSDQIVIIPCNSCITVNTSINATDCEKYTSPWGTIYNQTGIYNDTLITALGCDSIIQLNLTINSSSQSQLSISSCGIYTSPSGLIYTQSGTYTDTIAALNGCDSVITLNLTIFNNYQSEQSITSCGAFTSPWGTVYNQSGIYSDTLVASDGCDSILVINLSINAPLSLTGNQTSASCNLDNGIAIANASGGSGTFTYAWSNGFTGSTNTGLAPGNYTVVATDQNGCTAELQMNVGALPAADVGIVASDTLIQLGDTVKIAVSNGVNYLWSPALGLNCTDCPSVLAFPTKNTTYIVTGEDTAGCVYSRSVNIVVEIICNELFVPDIFSPNGIGEASNEKLCVYSNCIKEMTFGIYNRWGELIYLTNDINGCWDGTHKGLPSPTGVYVYRLYIEQLDGQKIESAGNITLVR
jgi:gliding motility-associated-like protein